MLPAASMPVYPDELGTFEYFLKVELTFADAHMASITAGSTIRTYVHKESLL